MFTLEIGGLSFLAVSSVLRKSSLITPLPTASMDFLFLAAAVT